VSGCYCMRADRNCKKCRAQAGTYLSSAYLAYLAGILANPPYSARPRWHAPAITRLDVTRTMAWCGSQTGGEE
jgi:hypothetical protein